MALAADVTSKIKMGPGVANPVTINYTALTSAMSAINEISDGRAVLGLGVGDSAVTPLGLRASKVSELEDITHAIRALASGKPASIAGQREPVEMLTANEPYPILISASQPKMLELAGRVADGVVLMGGANRELTEWQIDWVERGAKSAGRSLADVEIDVWFAMSISDDQAQARNDVRAWSTSQARWFSRWRELPPVLQPYKEQCQAAFEAYDFAEHLSVHSSHQQVVSDELVDLLAPSGSVSRCAEQIGTLAGLKIDRITFALLPGGRQERLRRTGEELLPALSW
jgi:5,10-methylenetetrahydromethanopterin reductase